MRMGDGIAEFSAGWSKRVLGNGTVEPGRMKGGRPKVPDMYLKAEKS